MKKDKQAGLFHYAYHTRQSLTEITKDLNILINLMGEEDELLVNALHNILNKLKALL